MRRSLTGAVILLHCASSASSDETAPIPRLDGAYTIQQAIETTRRYNLETLLAGENIQSAVADTRAARSMTRVQISANTYVSFGDNPSMLYTAGTVSPSGAMDVPQKLYGDQNITLMAPIYTGGRLQSLIGAARYRERAARADADEIWLAAALKTRESYYRVQLAAMVANAARARVDLDTEMLSTAEAQYEAGKGLQSTVLRVRAEMADAQRMLSAAKNLESKALIDVKAAMGIDLGSNISLTEAVTFREQAVGLDSWLARSRAHRPDLFAARNRIEASEQQTHATDAARGAQVYGMAMTDGFSSAPTGTRAGYTIGLVVSIPLSDGGQRNAELTSARLALKRNRLDLVKMQQQAEAQVREAYLDVQTATQNVLASEKAVLAAEASYQVTALRVQAQKSILVEELDSLAALTQARTNRAQALYDFALASATLDRAAGTLDTGGKK